MFGCWLKINIYILKEKVYVGEKIILGFVISFVILFFLYFKIKSFEIYG